jgi:hypothetical protein
MSAEQTFPFINDSEVDYLFSNKHRLGFSRRMLAKEESRNVETLFPEIATTEVRELATIEEILNFFKVICAAEQILGDSVFADQMAHIVSQILVYYVESLHGTYSYNNAPKDSFEEAIYELAVLQRDEIEIEFPFLSQEFDAIRAVLAAKDPERFLYSWEELQDGRIVMKKLESSVMKRSKKSELQPQPTE